MPTDSENVCLSGKTGRLLLWRDVLRHDVPPMPREAMKSEDDLPRQNDVSCLLSRLMFGDAITERGQIDAVKHRFASSQHDRRQGEVQVVDQPGAKILVHG